MQVSGGQRDAVFGVWRVGQQRHALGIDGALGQGDGLP
jgi:hypothetical protein